MFIVLLGKEGSSGGLSEPRDAFGLWVVGEGAVVSFWGWGYKIHSRKIRTQIIRRKML